MVFRKSLSLGSSLSNSSSSFNVKQKVSVPSESPSFSFVWSLRDKILPTLQTSGRCVFWRRLAGSLETPGSEGRTHTPAVETNTRQTCCSLKTQQHTIIIRRVQQLIVMITALGHLQTNSRAKVSTNTHRFTIVFILSSVIYSGRLTENKDHYTLIHPVIMSSISK